MSVRPVSLDEAEAVHPPRRDVDDLSVLRRPGRRPTAGRGDPSEPADHRVDLRPSRPSPAPAVLADVPTVPAGVAAGGVMPADAMAPVPAVAVVVAVIPAVAEAGAYVPGPRAVAWRGVPARGARREWAGVPVGRQILGPGRAGRRQAPHRDNTGRHQSLESARHGPRSRRSSASDGADARPFHEVISIPGPTGRWIGGPGREWRRARYEERRGQR
jgi:hypothetical protein